LSVNTLSFLHNFLTGFAEIPDFTTDNFSYFFGALCVEPVPCFYVFHCFLGAKTFYIFSFVWVDVPGASVASTTVRCFHLIYVRSCFWCYLNSRSLLGKVFKQKVRNSKCTMSKGRGGKIKNWEKKNSRMWVHEEKNIKMKIGNRTSGGYPVAISGRDVDREMIKKYNRFIMPKKKAEKYATKVRRQLK